MHFGLFVLATELRRPAATTTSSMIASPFFLWTIGIIFVVLIIANVLIMIYHGTRSSNDVNTVAESKPLVEEKSAAPLVDSVRRRVTSSSSSSPRLQFNTRRDL
jgi:hypothetical protein